MLTTEFKALHNLSNEQFRRMRIKAEQANPGIEIVTRQGSSDWLINDVELLIPHLPKPRESKATEETAITIARPGSVSRYAPWEADEDEPIDVTFVELQATDSSEHNRALEVYNAKQNEALATNIDTTVKAIIDQFGDLGDSVAEAAIANMQRRMNKKLGKHLKNIGLASGAE